MDPFVEIAIHILYLTGGILIGELHHDGGEKTCHDARHGSRSKPGA